jgi:flagellar biosynthesis/type III secretory pathway chaperone
MNNSLNVLAESLDVKLDVLSKIQEYTNKQKAVFEEETPNMEKFDNLVDEKDVLVDKLISLDEGFERLYQEVSDELNNNRSKYSAQIRLLQDKISAITDISSSIQAQEARNKKMIEEYFTKERQSIKKGRISSKAAYDYYKNMSGMNLQSPGFMDSKH